MSQTDDLGDEAMYPMKPRATFAAQSWRPLALILLVSILSTGTASAGPPAAALDVTVASLQGDVSVTVQARRLEVHKGDLVPLPATIYTGPSGSIELRQGNTTLSVAPNSQLEIPAPAAPGEPIDRVIQTRGNAFYNVAKRETRKLHVESAYLVAVIKGTQFSVVAQDDSATISLFEGRLEVRATDGSDIVDLQAGEVAIRHASDSAIRMLRMDTGEPVAHRAADHSATGAVNGAGPAPASSSNSTAVDGDAGNPASVPTDSGAGTTGRGGSTGVSSGGSTSLGSGSTAISGGVLGVLGSGSLGNGSAGAGASGNANFDNGSTNVSTGVAANLNNKSANANSAGGSNQGNGSAGAGAGGNSNSGNGNGGSNSGNGQSASNNGGSGGNANPGNGNGGSNNGNGHGASNKLGLGHSPNLGNGSTPGTSITTPVTQTMGINLGAPPGGAANGNPAGGLPASVTPHKGLSGRL